jgi:hypothetical protein
VPALIQQFRLSFIAVETDLALLGNPQPAGAPYAFLGRQGTYAQRFEAVRRGGPGAGGLAFPWKDVSKKSFWQFDFENALVRANGDDAWKLQAPFRRPFSETVSVDWLPADIALHGFFYPFGRALIITLVVRPSPEDQQGLSKVVDIALRIKRGGLFHWNPGGGQPAQDVDLAGLIDRGLATLRAEAHGAGALPGRPADAEPFSVLTVIRGVGVDIPDQVPDPPVDEAMQRVLWALSSWSPTYHRDRLQEFKTMSVQTRRFTPPEHVVYGSTRGRAIWFPSRFQDSQEGRFHPLGVYHRNLTDCTLQVEAICGFIQEVARSVKAGVPLAQEPLRSTARHAAGHLPRMYQGSATYRTWSARKQMVEKRELIDDLNVVRQQCDMPVFNP